MSLPKNQDATWTDHLRADPLPALDMACTVLRGAYG